MLSLFYMLEVIFQSCIQLDLVGLHAEIITFRCQN